MTRTRKWAIGKIALAAIGVLAFMLAAPSMQRSFFYPKPRGLPPVVADSTEHLLARLQSVLEANAPMVAQALQPGLSDEQISSLEREGGFWLSDDLRALYRWHNGMTSDTMLDLLPACRFTPLEEIVRDRALLRQQVASATAIQQVAFLVLAGHRKDWVTVFDDGFGDGYFFDPKRSDTGGAFFFHFAEVGYYVWFPSFRNFLAGVIECYETGVFKTSADGMSIDEDFEQANKIWRRYARMSEE
jgi:cell wall assembly regulator SMI1